MLLVTTGSSRLPALDVSTLCTPEISDGEGQSLERRIMSRWSFAAARERVLVRTQPWFLLFSGDSESKMACILLCSRCFSLSLLEASVTRGP